MSSNSGKILDFLSRFLPLADDWANDWKKFHESLRKLQDKIVFPSAYPEKKKFRLNLDFTQERLFFYCRFPWLGGRLVIVRVGYKESLASEHGLGACKNIPVLYAPGLQPALFNPVGAMLSWPEKDINPLLKSIRNSKADTDAIFSMIAMPDNTLPTQTVIVDFPDACPADNIFLRPAIAAAEQIILCPDSYLSRRAHDFIACRRPGYPVWVEPGKASFKVTVARKEHKPAADWATAGYIPFKFLCECMLYNPIVWNNMRARKYEDQISKLTEDLIMNNSTPELREILGVRRNETSQRLAEINDWLERYQKAAQELTAQAGAFDSRVIADSHLDALHAITLQHNNDWRVPEQHLLDLVAAGDLKKLGAFADRLAAKGYPYAGILSSARAVLGYGYADGSLYYMDTNLARILAVFCRNKLGMTDAEAGKRFATPLIQGDPHIGDVFPEIAYLAGMSLCLKGELEEGTRLLRQALKNGNKQAGEWLHTYAVQQNDKRLLTFLAKNLVPGACYDLAVASGDGFSHGLSLFRLYVAAASQHHGALRSLAEVERRKSFQVSDNREKSLHRRHAIGIYDFLLKNAVDLSSREYYYMGSLLRDEDKHQGALKYLLRSEEPEAHCLLGRIYHYGDGVSIDFDKAKSHYQTAIAKGNQDAHRLLAKLEITREQKARAATSHTSYEEKREYTGSSSSGSGSLCFLTTATCQVKGYDDDCHVLETYRRFRDDILLKSPEGSALVEEYYKIAPEILRKIDSRSDRLAIYEIMWNKYLEPGYQLILDGQYTAAKELYIALVTWLVKYLA